MKHVFNPFNCKIPRKYDPKFHLKDFESFHDAKTEKERRIRILEKGNRACRRLAKKLRRCKKKRRCLSNACPVCKRRFRRWFVTRVCPIFENHESQFVTVIPEIRQLLPRDLDDLSHRVMNDYLVKKLKRAGFGDLTVVGGIDIDFRTANENGAPSYWQPHFHFVAASEGSDDIQRLKQSFKKKGGDNPVRVPVSSEPIEDLIEAVSYTVKGINWEKAGYWAKNGRRKHRRIPLKPKQLQEILLVLDAHSMTSPLLMRGGHQYGCELLFKQPPVGEKPPWEE